ncbi:response regulator transcription factor [Hymenobacter sp. B81]|uniref:response regulator transcription factor n=1 Tax=Hymenobacter sp. B81 TaxID=3344878 RepID=UPI0037DC2713
MKVLIVEDELKVASFLKNGLEDYGIEAAVALDATLAQRLLAAGDYSTVILDVNLPEMSGFELCRYIRQRHERLPVLMLTAMASTDHKLKGFDAGADDYLVKPFAFEELLARLRALQRRYTLTEESVLKVADLELNSNSKLVKRGDRAIHLTARELALLEYFMQNQGRALTRQEIVGKVWDLSFDTGTNVVDVYVNYLRKKIDHDFSPKLIHTLNGIGYIFQNREA